MDRRWSLPSLTIAFATAPLPRPVKTMSKVAPQIGYSAPSFVMSPWLPEALFVDQLSPAWSPTAPEAPPDGGKMPPKLQFALPMPDGDWNEVLVPLRTVAVIAGQVPVHVNAR